LIWTKKGTIANLHALDPEYRFSGKTKHHYIASNAAKSTGAGKRLRRGRWPVRDFRMPIDLRLYTLVDPEHAGGHTLPDLARRAAEGGATLLQLRDKKGETREMVASARAIKAVLKPFNVPFIVNDRVDVALAAEADGVHVGQDDMDPADARRLLGPDAIIGLSVKTLADAQAAPLQHLTYVAIGGVFPTTSKDNKTNIGTDGLRQLIAAVRARAPGFPVGAIAGITETNAADVVAAGADGICAISALAKASDPAETARKLRSIVDAALEKRGRR
jgi:thiamine-phosphate pyrophosphorylase